MKSNCLIWALTQKIRYGGKVKIVRFLPLPRFIWINKNGESYFFKPINPKRIWIQAFIHKLWFTGKVSKWILKNDQ